MKTAIWGCGNEAKGMAAMMEWWGIEIDACVAYAKNEIGRPFLGKYVVQSPDMLQKSREHLVIVTRPDYNPVFKLLDSWGYKRGVSEGGSYCLFIEFYISKIISWLLGRKARPYFVFAPNLNKMSNCSRLENALKYMGTFIGFSGGVSRMEWLQSCPPHIQKCYGAFNYFSREYVRNIFTGSETAQRNGTLIQTDMQSPFVNVSAGMRVTTDSPEYYENSVHFFGPSYIYGFGVEDKYTIPSCVQRNLNELGHPFRCLNHGIRGMNLFQYFDKIKSVNIEENDYAVIYIDDKSAVKECLSRFSVSYIDTNEYLWESRGDDIFFDFGSHLNYKGNMMVSSIITDLVFKNFSHKAGIKENENTSISLPPQGLSEWISQVREEKFGADGTTGAIVMNCNPFTLGHYHLINIASQIVDFLYVFVVMEDRSEFAFNERFNLVKEGVKNMPNVAVKPSGEYIISAITFPEYFSKDSSKEAQIDMSMDIDIFGKFIARKLNISIRFVGEEPNDQVTRQYNESLKKILPKYGIKLLEIPRIKKGSDFISATTVRRMFHQGRLPELKQYVPECTYQYLKSRH